MDEALKLKKATYHLWTFTISKMISSLGSNVLGFGISLYILAMTGSATSFAVNMICSIVPRTLLAPIAGMMADKYSKKPIILIAQACTVLTMGGLLTYSSIFGMSVTAIYITTAIYSITSTFIGITFSSSIANLVDGERLQKATSFNQASLSVAAIGGPALGGMMYGFVSIEVFLIIHMAAYATAFLLEATMDFKLYSKKEGKSDGDKENFLQSFKEGFRYLKTKRVVSIIIWVALWINFFFSALNVGGTYVLVELLHVNSRHIGIIEASGAVGMLIASIYFATRKQVKYPLLFSKRFILLMAISLGLMTIPLWIEFSYILIVIFYIAIFISFSVFGVFTNTPIGVMMQTEVEEEYRGRVFGILETMAMAMMPLGTMLFGVLFDKLPAQWILLGSSSTLIVITLYMLRSSVLKEAYPELAKVTNSIKFTEKIQQP
ncbi:MFS transporter [Viridibacillus sp. FSL R5-0477]|uniref:Multidrug resistance protein n=1 Tax=Viridibacillus arenosi FSL R5-213 TaxID=1227360 RepID=W4ERF3_9BACL|nr:MULTISPECIES: MFS transporter [Viridibacillus]ETT82854.1 multidrug resistance protein [Viridibacillus arenosi FSL R5-213]OMC82196.1 MFS transporter [Viridibacillus sp. FSL H8-0123]OMC90743.1 MFS transporter [Viridibacillus arenosi]